ncbi:transglycosylase family protein [Streptomyces sp. NPDC059247]|uniref:transglycosylase family protein n=1 Tax=Streptomyces sp. NPDC059247 TaxID=3346790 RepID=UPI0036BD379F
MRSGNGRHRRPRQAPALVVAAGVTGSAMALPLLATGSASAADAATWDRVAECESGGQWSANLGNGRYGGLQFTQDSWERYGGLAYAPSPDLASRAQQIAVAEKALAKGSTAWASCAPIAGLVNDGARPKVNPGPADLPKPSGGPVAESNRTTGPQSSSAAEAARGAAGRSTGAPTAPATSTSPAAPSTGAPVTGGPTGPTAPASPDAPAPATTAPDGSAAPGTSGEPTTGTPATGSGKGKHRGDAAPEGTVGPGGSVETGRHAAPGDSLSEETAAKPVADASTNSGGTDSQGTSGAYTVKAGDSLSGIAQQNELPGGWTALYDANRKTVGTDPDLILPGQSLELTESPVARAE